MKTTHLIALFLSLSILFSNMAWAMDECSLTVEFSTHTLSQLGPEIIPDINSNVNTGSVDTLFSDDTSVENTCNTFCVGWTHLNYISYTVPVININKTHSNVVQHSFIYHFTQRKPPTEPPKI